MNNNCGISNKAGKSKFRLLSVALGYRMLNRDSDQHRQMEGGEEVVAGFGGGAAARLGDSISSAWRARLSPT